MNMTKSLFIIILALSGMSIGLSWAKSSDSEAFIETLRQHNRKGTQLEFSAQLRERISQDDSGDLILAIAGDAEINSAIFYNLDAAPERFLELVLAFWLEDDLQWRSRGGMYYSPATQLDYWLRNRIRPEESSGSIEAKNLYFVLEDKDTRIELAKVLRESYSNEELDAEKRRDRRAAAWNKIVVIEEEAFPRLLENDKKRRAEAAKESKPESGQFLKKLKQESPDDVTTNQPSGQANNSNISLRPEKRHDATPDKITKTPYASKKFIYWLMSALALVIFVTAMILLFKRRNV